MEEHIGKLDKADSLYLLVSRFCDIDLHPGWVAVVIEYLDRTEDNQPLPRASRDDARLTMLEDEDGEDESIDKETAVSEDGQKEISRFLKGKTKAQLIDLINEIAQQHSIVAQEIADRRQDSTDGGFGQPGR